MKKRNWILLPIAALLCFVWGNSLLNAETSGAISGGLLAWLIDTFPFLNWLPEYLLRKIGHFSEFGLLGFLLSWYFLLQGQQGGYRFIIPFFLSMLAANIDETLQCFAPGRGPSVVDVWIDSAGAAAGMTAFFVGYTVIMLLNHRKKGNSL